MFAFLDTFLQQTHSLMLIAVLIMVLIGFVLQRIIYNWQQITGQQNNKIKDAYWEEL